MTPSDDRVKVRIQELLSTQIPDLAPDLQQWIKALLVHPRIEDIQADASTDPDVLRVWIVSNWTANAGVSERVYYDPDDDDFGVELRRADGVRYAGHRHASSELATLVEEVWQAQHLTDCGPLHRGHPLDSLEVISANTTPQQEAEFLRYVRRNRDVRMIATQATLAGPEYVVGEDVLQSADGPPHWNTFLLWNTALASPLCWSPFLRHYDRLWKPINPEYATPVQTPRTIKDALELHRSFRQHPITSSDFASGHFDTFLSPVIDVSVSQASDCRYFHIGADFTKWVFHSVWLTWCAADERWAHEERDLEWLLKHINFQPRGFYQWQEELFDWIESHWANDILPQDSYRY